MPFAMYENKTCIFEYGINDEITINTISAKLWTQIKIGELSLLHIGNKTTMATELEIENVKYMFTIVLMNQDELDKLDYLKEKMEIAVSVLSTKNLEIIVLDTSENIKKEKIASKEQTFNYDLLNEETVFNLEEIFLHELVRRNEKSVQLLLSKLLNINSSSLSVEELLAKKYRFVSLITLISRICVKEGCPIGVTMRTSDKMIAQLDKVEDEKDIKLLLEYAAVEYYILLNNNSEKYDSKIINEMIGFVNDNLYHDINNKSVSKYMNMNTAYLSTLFKRETGIALKNYISDMKIKESKYLLRNTSMSIHEISTTLNFCSQSHFTDKFHQKTGYTPKRYQDIVNN